MFGNIVSLQYYNDIIQAYSQVTQLPRPTEQNASQKSQFAAQISRIALQIFLPKYMLFKSVERYCRLIFSPIYS